MPGIKIVCKIYSKNDVWKQEKANENVEEMSPYDPFVNENRKVGARVGRWTTDLVLMFLEFC